MLTAAEMKPEGMPKKRIGRAKFLLEFFFAALILKASASASIIPTLVLGVGLLLAIWANMKRLRHIRRSDWWVFVLVAALIVAFIYGLICALSGLPKPDDTINTNMMPIVIVDMVIPFLVLSFGFALAIWASVKRLRDIKQSTWWVSIILAAFPFGIVLGLTGLPAPDSNGDIVFKIVGGLYGVAYLAYLGVLLFKPSAYPTDVETVPIADDQLGNEFSDTARSTTGVNFKETMQIEEQKLSRMNRLNGWQRIGVVFSALWCFGVVAKASYESYNAASFNKSIAECCEEEKRRPFKKENKVGDYITWCEAADVCATGIEKPTAPQLLPFLALLLLPVAAGWLVVFLVITAIMWVREGVKTK